MKWIKASEQLPKYTTIIYAVKIFGVTYAALYNGDGKFKGVGKTLPQNCDQHIEWLDESESSLPEGKEAILIQIKAALIVATQTKKPLELIANDLMAHIESYADSQNRAIHDKLQQSLNQNAKDTLELASLRKENGQLKISLEMAQLGWSATTDKKDEWANQAKALSAVKKGMETYVGQLQSQLTSLTQSNEAKDKDFRNFLLWLGEQKEFQWTGETWDENTGHDDFERLSMNDIYDHWQQLKNQKQ